MYQLSDYPLGRMLPSRASTRMKILSMDMDLHKSHPPSASLSTPFTSYGGGFFGKALRSGRSRASIGEHLLEPDVLEHMLALGV